MPTSPTANGLSRLRTGTPTSVPAAANPDQRWLIQTDGGELLLTDGEDHLAQLLGSGRVTGTASVYEVGPGPRTLAQVPDLARVLSKAVLSEPPARSLRRPPEDALLIEELSLLDRPLDEEIVFDDERPARRWVRWVALLAGLAAAALGGYVFALPRFPELQSLVIARVIRPVSAAAHAVRGPTPALVVPPAPAPPTIPAVAPSETAAAPPSPPPPAPSAQAAPAADQEAGEADAPAPAPRRHASKKRSAIRH